MRDADGVQAAVDADPVRLQQITVVNLLSNASEVFEHGRPCRAVCRRRGAGSRDLRAGPGSRSFAGRCSTRSSNRSCSWVRRSHRSEGGLGLGLAIVYGPRPPARRLGQGVELPGRGKGERIRCPTATFEIAARSPPTSSARGRALEGTLRVLIVEDNSDVRSMLKTLLELIGHDVEVASDGLQGARR